MKRSRRVWLGVGFLAAMTALCACGAVEFVEGQKESEQERFYDELCVEDATMIRFPDQVCEDGQHDHSHSWVYVPYSSGVSQPTYPVGSKVTGGSFAKPSGSTFVRGGFGGFKGSSGG